MAATTTTNLIGNVGADSANGVTVTFASSPYVYVVISGSGKARAAFNGVTPVNNTDKPLVGGFEYLLRRLGGGGISSVTLYVDTASSGATLTYAVTPSDVVVPL